MGFHTHSDRLERWLGAEKVARLSRAMRDFYWPIAVNGVPGNVFALPGGDFSGPILAGSEASGIERAHEYARRVNRNRTLRHAMSRKQLGAFGTLSAIIAAATSGSKMQDLFFKKVGLGATAVGSCTDCFLGAGHPTNGSSASAAPGGTSPTNTTTGALPFTNPTNANTAHFITGWVSGSVIGNDLLLYDRLFAVAKTMNSTATEAVTGTFSRYQNQSSGAIDYIGGNFCFPVTTGGLPATGHNWTVCKYMNQDGTTGQSFPSIAGVASNLASNIDLALGNWFMPLAAGDVGVKALTQMQCSALVASGTTEFVVGHPIAWMPTLLLNVFCVADGINTAFSQTPILDNACLTFLEGPKPTQTATTYNGQIKIVAE